MAIDLTFIRELSISNPIQSGRPSFLSSASGLIGLNNIFYVIADDELHLGTFSTDGNQPGNVIPLFPGELPIEHKARKKEKSDWEALLHLDAKNYPPHGAILAIPSGSKSNRCLGVLISVEADQILSSPPQIVDFTPLYSKLFETLPDLNIEGAVIFSDTLKLFQRGNARSNQNAIIDLSLSGFLEDVSNQVQISARHILNISSVDLGLSQGVPLSFTDAALYAGDEIWFLAAAEDTDSTYADGEYMGATIGRLSESGNVEAMYGLNCPDKPEGLWFKADSSEREFFLVTDADRTTHPSKLYRGKIDG